MEEIERKTFTQERDFFREKLNEIEEEEIRLGTELDAQQASGSGNVKDIETKRRNLQVTKKFFERKLQQVEHDLFIVNKNKYDLIKFATYV